MDDILTTAQAAKLLGVSVRTAQLWVESGNLSSWKTPGGHRRIPRLAVAELIAGQAMRQPTGATAVVLTEGDRAAAWQALGKAGLLVEIIEDVLQAAIRIGELLPSLIVVDTAETDQDKLLDRLDADGLLASSLVVVRRKARSGAPKRVAARQHLVLDEDQNVADCIEAIRVHLSRCAIPTPDDHVPYPLPFNEQDRLKAVAASGLYNSPREESFDRLVELATRTFQAPMAMFTLLTSSQQWFKALTGFDAGATPRDWAFCNYTLAANQLTVFEDLSTDARFANNPMIQEPHHFRFYAGAPVRDENGYALGSICIIDRVPRSFGPDDRNALTTLSEAASNIIKWRAQERQLRRLRATMDA
ncbi:GAF domain-containing protein [Rhizobium sp. SAFR-030]|uniref:GAF domain-containing protein n=1 Tax=Rhizobium sp. SAFR-030 TaxID=3387277 RepID=UPI003F7E8602